MEDGLLTLVLLNIVIRVYEAKPILHPAEDIPRKGNYFLIRQRAEHGFCQKGEPNSFINWKFICYISFMRNEELL